MNKEVIKKWLAALRSGDYTQGQGALRSEDSFCCLGVLCDLYKKETKKGYWSENIFFDGEDQNYYNLPDPVANWAGLPSAYGFRLDIDGFFAVSLADLNDGIQGQYDSERRSYNFNQIADIIEKRMNES